MERETCAGCRFFEPDGRTVAARHSNAVRLGHCRHRSPIDHFPSVSEYDWCGDFEASGQEKAENARSGHNERWELLKRQLDEQWEHVEKVDVHGQFIGRGGRVTLRRPYKITLHLKDD